MPRSASATIVRSVLALFGFGSIAGSAVVGLDTVTEFVSGVATTPSSTVTE